MWHGYFASLVWSVFVCPKYTSKQSKDEAHEIWFRRNIAVFFEQHARFQAYKRERHYSMRQTLQSYFLHTQQSHKTVDLFWVLADMYGKKWFFNCQKFGFTFQSLDGSSRPSNRMMSGFSTTASVLRCSGWLCYIWPSSLVPINIIKCDLPRAWNATVILRMQCTLHLGNSDRKVPESKSPQHDLTKYQQTSIYWEQL